VEGAAKVRAKQVGSSVGCGGGERQAFKSARLQASPDKRHVEFRVDGVAGQRVVELEAQMLACGDGRIAAAEREPRWVMQLRGRERRQQAGWSGVRH
jgi:hypothetical protein